VRGDVLNILHEIREVFAESVLLQILLTVLCVLIAQAVIKKVIKLLVRRAFRTNRYLSEVDREKQTNTLIGVLGTMAGLILWVLGAIVILSLLKFNIATLATGAGLFGVIFGFGAQSVIKDYVTGLFIIGENQYRVGDIVKMQVAGVDISGVVEDLTIRITRLRDLDGNLHIISNGTAQVVTNLSYKYANVNVDIQVLYTTDVDTLEGVINGVGSAMAEDEQWAKVIFEPIQFLRIDDFTDAGMRIKALGKVEPAEQWEVAGEFRRRLKKELEKEGIGIAYPRIAIESGSPGTKR
jgi:small conductance mechanosensitive channel